MAPIDPLYQYLELGRIVVENPLRELERYTQYIPNYANLIKIRENWSRVSNTISPVVASYVRANRERDPKIKIAEPDRAEIAYLTLSCRNLLLNTVDWDHYARQFATSSDFQNTKQAIDTLVSNIESTSPEEFLSKQDVSRIRLFYYRVMDPISSKVRTPRLNMFLYAWLLRHYFEVGARLSQASVDQASTYFDRIVHSIQFPPAYYKAGMGILTQFNTILRLRYPDLNVKVRIEQDDLIVRMVIDTPDGTREIVEELLDKYMEVVRGNESAETLLPNSTDAMELRHTMQMMRMMIEHQRDMLQVQRKQIEEGADREKFQRSQVLSLLGNQESSLAIIGETVTATRDDAREWRELILAEMEGGSDELKHALLVLDKAIQRGKIDESGELHAAVRHIMSERPSLFENIRKRIVTAATSGAVGNGFYDLLLYLVHNLPHV